MRQENQEIERRDLSEPFSAWPSQGGSLSRVFLAVPCQLLSQRWTSKHFI